MAAAPDSRRWAAAGVAAVLLVFVVDQLTTADVALVTLSAGGPLIAAAGAEAGGARAGLPPREPPPLPPPRPPSSARMLAEGPDGVNV